MDIDVANRDKLACRVKSNTTLTTKNTASFHYFSKKNKANTLQDPKRYVQIFELETNKLHVQLLAAKMTQFHLKFHFSRAPSP